MVSGLSAPEPTLDDPEVAARRREFEALLGEFRRTAVLVPLEDGPGPDGERGLLTADLGGIRFILAFSDEQALARCAQVRGEYRREWTFQTILGARLLDVAVPAAGVPCGVARSVEAEEGQRGPADAVPQSRGRPRWRGCRTPRPPGSCGGSLSSIAGGKYPGRLRRRRRW